MFESSGGVDPLERVESDELAQQIQKIITSSSEDVCERSAGVLFELDVVW